MWYSKVNRLLLKFYRKLRRMFWARRRKSNTYCIYTNQYSTQPSLCYLSSAVAQWLERFAGDQNVPFSGVQKHFSQFTTKLEQLTICSLGLVLLDKFFFFFCIYLFQQVQYDRLPELLRQLEELKDNMNNFNSSLADASAVISNASRHSQGLKFEAEQLERYVRHQSEFM